MLFDTDGIWLGLIKNAQGSLFMVFAVIGLTMFMVMLDFSLGWWSLVIFSYFVYGFEVCNSCFNSAN